MNQGAMEICQMSDEKEMCFSQSGENCGFRKCVFVWRHLWASPSRNKIFFWWKPTLYLLFLFCYLHQQCTVLINVTEGRLRDRGSLFRIKLRRLFPLLAEISQSYWNCTGENGRGVTLIVFIHWMQPLQTIAFILSSECRSYKILNYCNDDRTK